MAIDTADYPTAQTKAKVIHGKSQAVSRKIETAFTQDRKGKTLCCEVEVR